MRLVLIIFGVLLFGAYSVWDEPTKEDLALATKSSAFIAGQYGNLPLHSNSHPAPGGKTYALRAERHGLVVFATYGLATQDEMARLRSAAKSAFIEFPQLQSVSLEFYEANVLTGKARFSSRETVLR